MKTFLGKLAVTVLASMMVAFPITITDELPEMMVYEEVDLSAQTKLENKADALKATESYEPWNEADLEGRLAMVNDIAAKECEFLGLPSCEAVTGKIADGSNVDAKNGKVVFDSEYIAECDIYGATYCTCYGVYRLYQFALVDLYNSASDAEKKLKIFTEAFVDKFAEDFANYIESSDDLETFQAYYVQMVETCARGYAFERTQLYMSLISH